MLRRTKISLIALAVVLLAGCNGIDPPFTGTYEHVFIYCGLGYNNLSGNLRANLEDMQSDVLPGLWQDKAIVAFCHNTVNGSYTLPNPPCLIRLYRGTDGKPVADTLKVYDNMSVSASKESLRTALDDIRGMFPAKHYGMLFSSHGSGWVPGQYTSSGENSLTLARARKPAVLWPETKAVGNQYIGSSKNIQWIELQDFADAIPMKVDYLILDNCLSGCVELAYELKDLCDYLVVSPTEILTTGMIYDRLVRLLMGGNQPDLKAYCEAFYDFYNEKTGTLRSGTITLVDCSKLEALAEAFRAVLDAHRDALRPELIGTVQRYYYPSSNLRFYYDLRDLAAQLGATGAEMTALDAALEACVPYHAETPSFFDLELERCCGLSIYIPEPSRTQLNNQYKTLSWNNRVHLVQ